MLVLTRKKGERVFIGDDIVVTLIDVRGDGVRIGFDAPRGVSIQRAEVIAAVSEANTEAAASPAATEDLLKGLLTASRTPQERRPAPERATPSPEPGPAAAPGTRPKPVPRRPKA